MRGIPGTGNQKGASMVEYSLLIALLLLVTVAVTEMTGYKLLCQFARIIGIFTVPDSDAWTQIKYGFNEIGILQNAEQIDRCLQ